METLAPVVSESKEQRDLVIVRVPLRWYPSAAAPGMVLVSDRLFELFPILRPLHRRELAYAVFLEEERAAALRREPLADVGWVAEGLAWRRADELYRSRFPAEREVKDWIRLFDVFAIVDRFDADTVAREKTTFFFDDPAPVGRAFVTSIAHDNRHLGELEYVKGLLGLRGTATR